MARRCLACSSPLASEINERLNAANRPSLARLAAEFGLTPDALERHAARHRLQPVTDLAAGDQRGAEEPTAADHLQPERLNRSARAGQRRAGTVEVKQRFLDAYARTGNVTQSVLEAGVSRRTVYTWQETDEQFVVAMREAENQAIELLEAEARERATTGGRLVREVYRDDRLIERIVEYRPSDAVLVKLLQALKPEKYGDKLAVTQTTLVKTLDQAAWEAV
jgi:hypothetical protein